MTTKPANQDTNHETIARLFTIQEAAERLRVSARHLQIMIASGEIESFRHGRLIRLTARGLNEYVERHTRKVVEPTMYDPDTAPRFDDEEDDNG